MNDKENWDRIILAGFLRLLFWMSVPKFIGFAKHGLREYMGDTLMNKRLWFLLHMSYKAKKNSTTPADDDSKFYLCGLFCFGKNC